MFSTTLASMITVSTLQEQVDAEARGHKASQSHPEVRTSVDHKKPELSSYDIMYIPPTIPHTHCSVVSSLCKWHSGYKQAACYFLSLDCVHTCSLMFCKLNLHKGKMFLFMFFIITEQGRDSKAHSWRASSPLF